MAVQHSGPSGAVAAGGMSVELPLWRAISWYRVLAMVYALIRYDLAYLHYRHPVAGWIYLGALVLWTLATSRAFGNPARCPWPMLGFDLVMSVTGVVLSGAIDTPARIAAGAVTVPTIWAAGTVLGFAAKGGWRLAAVAGLLVGGANFVGHGGLTLENVHNCVLLLLTGCAIGYVIELARASEATLGEALRVEAANRERERLSRDIHDGVLQVLALVQRQAGEAAGNGGRGLDPVELGRLAGEQERALRALMTGASSTAPHPSGPAGAPGPSAEQDVRVLLAPYEDERVTLATPGTPVLLPGPRAEQLAAAVGAAVDNVHRHAGSAARAWILLEDEPDAVTVSIRDDGPGFPAGRLARARLDGRLGVAQSIEGRLRDLGGTAEFSSEPGAGVEVELRVPRED
ncbi:MacS family sensor histidine kinase [Kitasatospora sp. NPDC008050]|uniref:MacS family sensor histidine kinase n=1 Tax=Kitasatospora sp. NPDC008050 TaxID=3364021 RepID=UPI0036E2ED63